MSTPKAAFYGDFSTERIRWEEVGQDLGCQVCLAPDLEALRDQRTRSEVIAVFADYRHATEFPKIQACVPDARLVVCYPFCLPLLADELVALGAFHSIPRPLSASEVRQSLGFVWENWMRRVRNGRARYAAA